MEPEVDQWRAVVIDLKSDVKIKDIVITVLSVVVLVMTTALVLSMWGWFSTKAECSRSREEINGMKKICSNKNMNKV